MASVKFMHDIGYDFSICICLFIYLMTLLVIQILWSHVAQLLVSNELDSGSGLI